MKRVFALLLGLAIVLGVGLSTSGLNSMAQSGSPEASPVVTSEPVAVATPDLEGMILDLQATVSAQADAIAALQTQVAELAAVPATTPVSDTTGLHNLTVILSLQTRPDEMNGEAFGEECSGAGRWSDLGPDTAITISDLNGKVLATASPISGKIIVSGQLFRECELRYSLLSVPAEETYRFEIDGRSRISYTYEQLDAVDWIIRLSFGP